MSQWTRPEPDMPISEDTARAQVMLLLEGYDIDPATKSDPAEEALTDLLDKLAKYIRRGIIEIDDKLNVTQHRKSGPDVIYKKLTGAAVRATDEAGDGKNYKKIFLLMSNMAGLPIEAFSQLPGDELSVVETLALIFLSR